MTLHLGFISLGEHQLRAHLKHLITLKAQGLDLEFVGAFDPRASVFPEVKEKYLLDLPSYPSVKSLLNQSGLDVVFISSPDQFHGEHLAMALDRGCHIFCEKPMAVTPDDLRILEKAVEVSEETGRILSTCHPRRFDPPFLWLKEHLPTLEMSYGRSLSFDFSFWYHEVTDAWKKDRSLLSDHFGHEIDIFRFLFGASPFQALKVRDGYQHYEVLGTTPGPSFRFFGSRSLPESVYQETLQIDFEKTRLFLNLNGGFGYYQPSDQRILIPGIDYDARFYQVNHNFLGTILGQETSYLTADDILCNNTSSVKLTQDATCLWQ